MTCPDIAFAVSTLSQYLDSSYSTHIQAVTRVFCYLSATKELKLVLGGTQTNITGCSDANWDLQIHCHSISGFTFFVGIGTVSWSSKKQPIITLSSTKAEYVTLTHSSKDIIWIHKLLTEFSSIFSFTVPTTLFCDNQGAIHLSKDSTFHSHTKHIDIHFHFNCQTISHGHNIALLMTWLQISLQSCSLISNLRSSEAYSESSSPHPSWGGVSLSHHHCIRPLHLDHAHTYPFWICSSFSYTDTSVLLPPLRCKSHSHYSIMSLLTCSSTILFVSTSSKSGFPAFDKRRMVVAHRQIKCLRSTILKSMVITGMPSGRVYICSLVGET